MLVQTERKIQQLESAQTLMSWCWLSEVNKVRFVSCESFLPQIPERTKIAACVSSKVKSLHLSDSILSTQIFLRTIYIYMPSKRRAKNHASFYSHGKTPSANKVFYLCKTERKVPACHEGRMDDLQSAGTPVSFIANGVVSRLGHLTDLLREVMFGEHITDWW
jgi:hypothetical protein